MPWKAEHTGTPDCEWSVVKIATGEAVGCHATEDEANAQVRALYANEPTLAAALVAAVHVISIEDAPPREWFDEHPTPPEHGQITVTDQGRVYGFLARRGVAHRGYDRRVVVPTGNVDYSRWMNRETILADGSRIATGTITMDCGHASVHPSVQAAGALDHYDNTCSIAATARVGERDGNVWIAGAVLPGTTPRQVSQLLASGISGDWRPHRDAPGKYELCGVLAVPVPGFPVSNPAMAASAAELSGVPVHFEQTPDCGCHTADTDDSAILVAAGILARSVQRDVPARAKALAARVGKA